MKRAWLAPLLLTLAPGVAAAERVTLDEVVRLAVAHNEQAQIAAANAALADAHVAHARAYFFPTVSVTGTYTRRAYQVTRSDGTTSVIVQSHNALSAVATVNATLYDARAFPLYNQAKLERRAAQLSALDARRLVAYQAADAFLQTLASQQVAEASARHLAFARTTLLDAQQRLAARLVSSNDVTRDQLAVATAERDFTRATGAVRTARLELGFLIGQTLDGELAIPSGLLDLSTTAAAELGTTAEAQQRRLDVAATSLHVDALREAAKEPSRRVIPSLAAFGQFRATNEAGLSGHYTDWSVGLTLTWNLWDGGLRAADESAAKAQVAIADLQAKLTRREVGLELDASALAIEDGQAAVKSAAAALEFAKQNAAESAELYHQGLTTALTVEDAGAKLLDAEVALARERYTLATVSLDRRSALGLGPTGQESAR